MPIYKAEDLKATPDVKNPNVSMIQFGGELMKIGIVTYQSGEGPPPHIHPNDEQWIYPLEGRAAFIVGDQMVACGAGDVIHIPRHTVHGIRILQGPFRFFSCKSPAGTGKLSEDYTDVPNQAELRQKLAQVK